MPETPDFDPALPANNSPVSSSELRNQFNALKGLIDNIPAGPPGPQGPAGEVDIATLNAAIDATALNPSGVEPLVFGEPITEADLPAIVDKLNEILAALKRAP